MSQPIRSALAVTWATAIPLDIETKPKFFDERLRIFWVKLADFMDIVPRHRHLEGLRLWTRAMRLHEDPFGKGVNGQRLVSVDGEGVEKREGPNGSAVNGNMVNGYR